MILPSAWSVTLLPWVVRYAADRGKDLASSSRAEGRVEAAVRVVAHQGEIGRAIAARANSRDDDLAVRLDRDASGHVERLVGADRGENHAGPGTDERRCVVHGRDHRAQGRGYAVRTVADIVADRDLAAVVRVRRDGVAARPVAHDGAVVDAEVGEDEGGALGIGEALKQLGLRHGEGGVFRAGRQRRLGAGEQRRVVHRREREAAGRGGRGVGCRR